MTRIGSRSFVAVAAAAVAMLWWSGCATTSPRAPVADQPPPAAEEQQDDITCCPVPEGAVETKGFTGVCMLREAGRSHEAPTIRKGDYDIAGGGDSHMAVGYARLHPETGNYVLGHAWLHPETGEFCAEEAGAVRYIPKGDFEPIEIKGPRRGNITQAR